MIPLLTNMIGAGRFNIDTYEHVETDSRSTAGAFVVVILASLAAGVGSGVTGILNMVDLTLITILSWLIWVGLTYEIGTRLFPTAATQATFGQVLRTTGFSAAPGVLRVLGVIPVIGWLIFVGATIWMLFTFVVAVREALRYTSTSRAFFVCLLGWLIHGLVLFAFVLKAV